MDDIYNICIKLKDDNTVDITAININTGETFCCIQGIEEMSKFWNEYNVETLCHIIKSHSKKIMTQYGQLYLRFKNVSGNKFVIVLKSEYNNDVEEILKQLKVTNNILISIRDELTRISIKIGNATYA